MPQPSLTDLMAFSERVHAMGEFTDNIWTYLNEQRDWAGGTVDGGPEGDGRYPFTMKGGEIVLVPSPALIATGFMFSGESAPFKRIPLVSGMNANDVRSTLQGYIDEHHENYRLLIPRSPAASAFTWLLDGELLVPDNCWIEGIAGFGSVLKLADGTARGHNLFTPARNVAGGLEANLGTYDVVIRNLTLDGNRTGTTTGGARGHTSGCGLGMAAVIRGRFENIRSRSWYNHGVSIDGNRYPNGGPTAYPEASSRFVVLQDVEAWDCGDDQITTHYCSDVWLTRVIGHDASGTRVPGNANAIEVDDGTRNFFLTDCMGYRCDNALQIKGHNYAPAPYNGVISNFRSVNCRYGVEVRHTGFYGARPELEDDPEYVDEDGNSFAHTGSSVTARNLQFSNIQVIAPRGGFAYPAHNAQYGVRIRSYENVQITNLTISEGTLDLGGDWQPATPLAQYPMRVYSGARGVHIKNLQIYGFASKSRGLYSAGSFGGGMTIDGFTCIDGPQTPIYCTSGADDISVSNWYCRGNPSAPGDRPIYLGGQRCWIGPGHYHNFSNGPTAEGGFRMVLATRSTGDNVTRPQAFVDWEVHERAGNDIGQGEGASIRYKLLLTSTTALYAGVPREVGRLGFEKASSNDSSFVSDLVAYLLPENTDGQAIVPRFRIRATDGAWVPGGQVSGPTINIVDAPITAAEANGSLWVSTTTAFNEGPLRMRIGGAWRAVPIVHYFTTPGFSVYPVGHVVAVEGTPPSADATVAVYRNAGGDGYTRTAGGTQLAGTWASRGRISDTAFSAQRIA